MSRHPPVDSSVQACADLVCATHADQRRALAKLFAHQPAATPVARVHFAFEHQRPAQGATLTRRPRMALRQFRECGGR